MSRSLEGRVALITGTSRGGIGTAIAQRFAAEGASVAMAARSIDGLRIALALVEAEGSRGAVFEVDLADPAGARLSLVEQVCEALGPVDILVNNSAMGGYKLVEDWTLAQLRTMAEVNLWGPWLLTQHVLPTMKAAGRGAILNISSASAELVVGPPFPSTAPARAGSAYGATKAALNRFTTSVASESYVHGIVANALSPQAAAATPALVASGWLPEVYFEPLDTMAEAALALCVGGANGAHDLTGRIAYSLELLVELGAPVYDVSGCTLLAGWQPADLPARIAAQRETMRPR